jgi:hypothetical protein
VQGLVPATLLWSDISTINSGGALDDIDPVRAKILQKWQSESNKKHTRAYKIFNNDKQLNISINSSSKFSLTKDEEWVVVERYFSGKVQDMGGAKANIHLKLESGETLLVGSEIQQISDEKRNHLYKEVMLYVKAEQNLKTNELKNVSLFEICRIFSRRLRF